MQSYWIKFNFCWQKLNSSWVISDSNTTHGYALGIKMVFFTEVVLYCLWCFKLDLFKNIRNLLIKRIIIFSKEKILG